MKRQVAVRYGGGEAGLKGHVAYDTETRERQGGRKPEELRGVDFQDPSGAQRCAGERGVGACMRREGEGCWDSEGLCAGK